MIWILFFIFPLNSLNMLLTQRKNYWVDMNKYNFKRKNLTKLSDIQYLLIIILISIILQHILLKLRIAFFNKYKVQKYIFITIVCCIVMCNLFLLMMNNNVLSSLSLSDGNFVMMKIRKMTLLNYTYDFNHSFNRLALLF